MTTGSIALDVCRELNITLEELRGGCRRQDVVDARKIAIFRFKAAGFNNRAISRMLSVHYDTIRYWVNPDNRAKKLARLERLKRGAVASAAKRAAMIEEARAAMQ